MIYVVAIGLALAAFGLYRRRREIGAWSALLDALASAFLGWIAGILIGIGARIGMASIPFFNKADYRFTIDGTIQVILTFSLAGIGLGLVYELFFRRLLREHGWTFGLLVAVCSWYSIANAGLQQIQFDPPFTATAAVSGIIVAIMFVPYSAALETLLDQWHRHSSRALSPAAEPHRLS